LHATYRHDLKIKASDEGRVMKTAAAFTKGLLGSSSYLLNGSKNNNFNNYKYLIRVRRPSATYPSKFSYNRRKE
jgi:hypothetical protein